MFPKTPTLFNTHIKEFICNYVVNAAIKKFAESKVKDLEKQRKTLVLEQVSWY